MNEEQYVFKENRISNTMADFNIKMQSFRKKAEIFGLKFYMWPYWFYYQNKRFKESYWPAYKRNKNKKGIFKIFKDILFVSLYWRVLPYHYFRYGLYKREFSLKKIKEYIPETVVYYRILPKINSNYFLLDNKNIFETILNGSNLPYPRTILKIQKGIIFDSENKIIDSKQDFKKLIEKEKNNKLFLKPADCGSGGKEIVSYNKVNGHYFSQNKEEINFENISRKLNTEYILQEGIENYGFLKEIHPYSLNTFRVMTFFDRKIGAKVIYAILKAGNNEANTDNAHTGGIYVGINLENGNLMDKGFDEDLNEFLMHPLTKIDFRNENIKDFKKVIEIAEKAGNLFPSLTFIGWDIALTKEGPVILEGNSSPGLTIIQRTQGGLKKFYDKANDYIKNNC